MRGYRSLTKCAIRDPPHPLAQRVTRFRKFEEEYRARLNYDGGKPILRNICPPSRECNSINYQLVYLPLINRSTSLLSLSLFDSNLCSTQHRSIFPIIRKKREGKKKVTRERRKRLVNINSIDSLGRQRNDRCLIYSEFIFIYNLYIIINLKKTKTQHISERLDFRCV